MTSYASSDLEKLLVNERNFFDDTIAVTGAYRDHTWIPSLASRTRGFEIADDMIDHYERIFNRLVEFTSDGLDLVPAYKDEVMVMRTLNQDYLIPTKDILIEAREFGRNKLTAEEAAKITYNLIPLRIYADYRNGSNYIRMYYLVNGRPVAFLVKNLDRTLRHFVKSWYDTFKPGPVRVFGYINYAGVDAMDGTYMPQIITSDDPTDILLKEIPNIGIKKVITDPRPEIQEEITNSIKRKRREKKKHLTRKLCNVSAFRRRVIRRELGEYSQKIKRLGEEKIEEIGEEQKERQEQAAQKAYERIVR